MELQGKALAVSSGICIAAGLAGVVILQSLDIPRREVARVSVPEALDLVQDQQVCLTHTASRHFRIAKLACCHISFVKRMQLKHRMYVVQLDGKRPMAFTGRPATDVISTTQDSLSRMLMSQAKAPSLFIPLWL